MTSGTGDREYHSAPQVSFQMEVTPEQHAMLRAWCEMVPTLHFLDICVVNATKHSDTAVEQNPRKAGWISQLRERDRPQHAFSYRLALIEKTSDLRSSLSDEALKEQISKDVTSLRLFFRNARVIEPDEFLFAYLENLRRVPLELSQPAYLDFLTTANNKFALREPVAPRNRFQTAKKIVFEADSLSISRQHPVVLIILACLYGNTSAKKVMKFKADADEFVPQNALSDIMVISRFLPLKMEIEDSARRGQAPYARTAFITDDSGLQGILRCFEPKLVRHSDKGDHQEIRTDVNVNLAELLSDLEAPRGDGGRTFRHAKNQQSDEYDRICDLLFQVPELRI